MCLLQRILCTELLQRLMHYQPGLARAVALAAEVDCLISLAQVARDHGYCRPTLTQDNVLRIIQGAHPSLPHLCDGHWHACLTASAGSGLTLLWLTLLQDATC